jgi:hypothetical protein
LAQTLIDLDADRLDDGAPFIDLRFEESLKLVGGRAHDHVAGLFQLALDPGSARAATVSTLIFLTISGDVLAGTNKPCHDDTSYPGTPASSIVGNSGATGSLLALVTASARTWPDRIFSSSAPLPK